MTVPAHTVQENNSYKTNGKPSIDVDLPVAFDEKLVLISSAISNGNGHTDHSLDNKMYVLRLS